MVVELCRNMTRRLSQKD